MTTSGRPGLYSSFKDTAPFEHANANFVSNMTQETHKIQLVRYIFPVCFRFQKIGNEVQLYSSLDD